MEAMLLLKDEDFGQTKIPRGQQKLILAAVQKLIKLTQRTDEFAHLHTSMGDDVTQEGSLRLHQMRLP